MQHGKKLRTNSGSWFMYNFFNLVNLNIHDSFPPAIVWSESVDRQVRVCLLNNQNPTTKKNYGHIEWDPYSADILGWLQEFRENIVDDRVPERRATEWNKNFQETQRSLHKFMEPNKKLKVMLTLTILWN